MKANHDNAQLLAEITQMQERLFRESLQVSGVAAEQVLGLTDHAEMSRDPDSSGKSPPVSRLENTKETRQTANQPSSDRNSDSTSRRGSPVLHNVKTPNDELAPIDSLKEESIGSKFGTLKVLVNRAKYLPSSTLHPYCKVSLGAASRVTHIDTLGGGTPFWYTLDSNQAGLVRLR
jgi:hypothetical protein